MPPELKADAESTPKHAVRLPPSAQFNSLKRPQKAPRAAGKPMKLPMRLGPRMDEPFRARKPATAHKPVVAGSTSPQPRLSVPSAAARSAAPDARPQAARQSTPIKERGAARAGRAPPAGPAAGPVDGPAEGPPSEWATPLYSGDETRMPCYIDGRKSMVVFSKSANDGLVVDGRRFSWAHVSFTVQRHDVAGDQYEVRLFSNGAKRAAFVVNYANKYIFKLACEKQGATVTQVGDHRPPESLKKLKIDSSSTADSSDKTVDVVIYRGDRPDDQPDKATITLNRQGIYMNKWFKKFEWRSLSIVPRPAAQYDLRVTYDLYHGAHRLTMKMGRKEAVFLDHAIKAYNVSTSAPVRSPDVSSEAASSPQRRRVEPKAESSPKSDELANGSSPQQSSPQQSSPIPASLRSVLDDKRHKLLKLGKPLPTPSARPREPKSAASEVEISPQAFYGQDANRRDRSRSRDGDGARSSSSGEASLAPGSPPPRSSNGSSRTDPINLTSPEKPPRRLRRRARPDADDLSEDAPVEPTTEDFQILRDAGFHRVAHRFWDGRLMEVSVEDIARLNPRIYVNDNIIWFFLRWYLEQLHTHDRAMFDKILLLNTFFYPEVRKGDSPKWVTKLPILSKHITVMPIHEAAHWSVAVIIGLDEAMQPESTTKPTVVVLDSLGPAQNHQTFRKVVSVLRSVLRMHNKPQLTTRDYRSLRTTVPVQTNLTDCGVYLLHYVEQIFERPDVFLHQVSAAQDRTLDMGEFWREPELQTKRDDLKRRLKRLGSADNSAEVAAGQSDEDDDDIEVVGMEQVRRKRRKVGAGAADGTASQSADASTVSVASRRGTPEAPSPAPSPAADEKAAETRKRPDAHDAQPASTTPTHMRAENEDAGELRSASGFTVTTVNGTSGAERAPQRDASAYKDAADDDGGRPAPDATSAATAAPAEGAAAAAAPAAPVQAAACDHASAEVAAAASEASSGASEASSAAAGVQDSLLSRRERLQRRASARAAAAAEVQDLTDELDDEPAPSAADAAERDEPADDFVVVAENASPAPSADVDRTAPEPGLPGLRL